MSNVPYIAYFCCCCVECCNQTRYWISWYDFISHSSLPRIFLVFYLFFFSNLQRTIVTWCDIICLSSTLNSLRWRNGFWHIRFFSVKKPKPSTKRPLWRQPVKYLILYISTPNLSPPKTYMPIKPVISIHYNNTYTIIRRSWYQIRCVHIGVGDSHCRQASIHEAT